MNINETKLIQTFFDFQDRAIYDPQHFFAPQDPTEPVTTFDKIQWMVINEPYSMLWSQEQFAQACDSTNTVVSKIFNRVISQDRATKGTHYPGRMLQHYDRIIIENKGIENYLSKIIVKHTDRLKNHVMQSIQTAFNPDFEAEESSTGFVIDDVMPLKCPIKLQENSTPVEWFLHLLQDAETFSMSQKDVADRIKNYTSQSFTHIQISKFLRKAFGEGGTLWPARKINHWDTELKKVIEQNDPYLKEKHQYYMGMKLEVMTTIRERCWT